MFHINSTFENLRIIATSDKGGDYQVNLIDNCTGKQYRLNMTAEQLQMVLAFNLSDNGEPDGFADYYKTLEPLLAQCPPECRPIP